MEMKPKVTSQDSLKPKKPEKISRRTALKLMGGAAVGAGVGLVFWGADKISQKAREFSDPNVQKGLSGVIEKMKKLYPDLDQWTRPEDWSKVIYEKCEENQLAPTEENLCLILTLIGSESGFRVSPRAIDFWTTPSEKFIEETGLVEPRTGGPMEVTIKYIMDQEKIGYEEALEKVSTIREGVGYGIKHLKKIINMYKDVPDNDLKLKCIFADYNAGLFASRNAGVQVALNKIGNSGLREDGLLFSQTEKAIEGLFLSYDIPITTEQIKKDLAHTVNYRFPNSQTWKAIEELNKKLNGGNIPVTPADRPVLGFAGFVKKALTDIGSSREFAEHRLMEFNQIMKLILEEEQVRTDKSLKEVKK